MGNKMNDYVKRGWKASSIKKMCNTKIDEWLATIKDPLVRNAAQKDVIVTGGAIASMLLGEKINDWDVYFCTKETTKAVAHYYVDQFNDLHPLGDESAGSIPTVREETITNCKGETEERVVIWLQSAGIASEDSESHKFDRVIEDSAAVDESKDEGQPYRPVFMSQNAITLSNQLQIVIRFFGKPEEIHKNYDYVHATNWWMKVDNKLELYPEALQSLLNRALVYRGSLYPIASIFRVRKFMERGWRVSAGELLKIMWQISELDLADAEVLKEQLTGVDMMYMWALIDALKSLPPKKITSEYVGEVIDRIFAG